MKPRPFKTAEKSSSPSLIFKKFLAELAASHNAITNIFSLTTFFSPEKK